MSNSANANREVAGVIFAGAVLLLALCMPAQAHNGPPFPIIENKNVGPYIVSLWTHPDVGTGTFFVIVESVTGGAIPSDLDVEIGVRPADGRLSEVLYPAQRDNQRGQVQYSTQVAFDQQELWRVRLILKSATGGGEALSQVTPTPAGLGRWDLLLYLLPFLMIAFLWVLGISKMRSGKGVTASCSPSSSRRIRPHQTSSNQRGEFR